MKYGKIENYKVVGTCITQSENYPDVIPDDAELFDYIVGDELFKAADYQNKIISVKGSAITWSDDTDKINAEADARRRSAYTAESDPLFFKECRGEVPVGTSAAKVAEIRARFPKIGE